MKKGIFLISFILCIFFLNTKGQNDIDAFRFSQTDWSGTARFIGAGGAFGAVGAEFSALATNPASIGVFKKSEVTFTPLVVTIMNSSSSYNKNLSKYLSNNYHLSNAGVVLAFSTKETSNWKGVQFGFGYNRIADFNNELRIEGTSANSSIMDEFVNAANQSSRDLSESGPFDTYLAWNTWLLDYDSTQGTYYSPLEKQSLKQSKYIHTSGSIDEMNFSLGGNYGDKLYLGGTIGVPFINYIEKSTYEEVDETDSIGGFENFEMEDYLYTRGTGINFKIGLLYQPVDFMRFGFAFHTPTFFNSLKDTYRRDLIANYSDRTYSDESPEQYYRYKLTTPLRIMGNLAFFIKKRAFISAEYEFANYGMSSLFANDYSFSDENQDIRNKYGAQHSVRVGGEVALNENFLIRLGYNYKSSPYKENINDGSSHTASGGIGFRSKSFFLDLAYALKLSKEKYWLYSPIYVNEAETEYAYHKIALTAGFKF